jgi:hypothetical protein
MRNAALVAKPLKKVALRGSSPHPTTQSASRGLAMSCCN